MKGTVGERKDKQQLELQEIGVEEREGEATVVYLEKRGMEEEFVLFVLAKMIRV
ncbi:hypothetical protein A2U01_0026104 [Trifolium medium]|uniref:Uncharacterized protein n=1 Tax=Trifolium medium TaxID=97028 RepID=A0A392P2L9_9FABA|nr:hypothetical protein [Trifolium medium]